MNALISTPADCEGARRDSVFAGGERQTLWNSPETCCGLWWTCYERGQCPKKEHLAGKRRADAEDLQHAVVDWLNRQAAVWYEDGINKLVSRYDRCLSVQDDFVEK